MLRGDGPLKVLEKVNDNAYKLELQGDMSVSTFNVGDLTRYLEDYDDGDGDDVRENHNQKAEDEANVMPISIQESTRVLFSTQKLHHNKLGPCTNLELSSRSVLIP